MRLRSSPVRLLRIACTTALALACGSTAHALQDDPQGQPQGYATSVAPVPPEDPPPRLAAAPVTSIQSVAGGAVFRPLGPQYGFKDKRDASRFVWVCLGGVELAQGGRTLRGDTLVLVLSLDALKEAGATGVQDGAPSGPDAAPAAGPDGPGPDGGYFVSDARLLELYLDGNVSVQEGDEVISGASSFLLDNATGIATIVRGELRTVSSGGETIVARYELLHRLRDGTAELTGLSYTNCDHANPHWHIETPHAVLKPTPDGRVLQTDGNTVRWGDVPLLWWPGMNINVDRDRLLIHRISIGSSTRFGTEVETAWEGDAGVLATGVAKMFGYDERVRATWGLDVNSYSKRGLFTQPSVSYRTDDSFGTLFGSYINDSASEDHLGQPIDDHHRGRIDLEHRTHIDATKTLDLEYSYLSDSNYLQEYYQDEFDNGKPQETYVSYRDVVDNHAVTALVQERVNDFLTQVEYKPTLEHHVAGQALGDVIIGDAFITMRDFISNAQLLPADGTAEPTPEVLRIGSVGEMTWPIDLDNGDRVEAQFTQSITGFSKTVDEGKELRYAATWGGAWNRTYVGTGEAHSETWNIDGIRRILELRAGFFNRFALTQTPDDLIQIDEVEQLKRTQAFLLELRDRIQTHQNDRVATLLDTQLTMPIYPDADRDNEGETFGSLQLDTRWRPHANITGLQDATLRWRANFNPETEHYEKSFASFSTAIADGTKLIVGNNAVAGQFNVINTALQWELNPRWTVAVFLEQETRDNDKLGSGILLRQKAHCWVIDIEFASSQADKINGESDHETSFTISLTPIGTEDEDLTSSLQSRIF